ncbi:MAG TPA: phosphoglycerate kinase [Spirochaetia bacterium]|nr:MAG: phosphoglycerate kinase [Spirochaetes bacterium GWB1_36_13]HCL56543.1 phosphoglycerate kinase [Spirochaetia bacterium]
MIQKIPFKEINIEKKKITIRIDINSSIQEGKFLVPEKIKRYKSVFEYLIEKKAKTAVLFEMGSGRIRYPLKVKIAEIAENLSDLLGIQIHYPDYASEKELAYALEEILPGEVHFFENLALSGEEEKENSSFFSKIEDWAEIYINDALEVSSKPYYSFKKLPEKIESYAGGNLIENVSKMASLFSSRKKPMVVILGGIDVDEFMIQKLFKLSEKADALLFTGAWVPYFAQIIEEAEKENWMDKKKLKSFEKALSIIMDKPNVFFPKDVKVYKHYQKDSIKIANVPIDFIKKGLKIGDIGRETLKDYQEKLENAELILWMGSVGKWWKEGLATGTQELAKTIQRRFCDRMVIGNDLLESLRELGFDPERFSYLDYGDGDTTFQFLMDGKIIGVDNLKNTWNI